MPKVFRNLLVGLVGMGLTFGGQLGLPSLTAVRAEGSTPEAAPSRHFYSIAGLPEARTPEIYQGSFLDLTKVAMLSRLKILLEPEDRAYFFPDPALGIGSQVLVYRAQVFLVKDGDLEVVHRSWAQTVGEVLTEKKYELAEKDIIEPEKSTPIIYSERSQVIEITRVSESELRVVRDVPFKTTYVDDPSMIVGTTKVNQVGVNGKQEYKYLVRRENGAEVKRTLISTAQILDPVSAIIAKGTKPKWAYLTTNQYQSYFSEATTKYNVPADQLKALMLCESGGNINSVSAGGTYKGLFQFDDLTWSRTDYRSYSIFDARAQILAAASLWTWRSQKWPGCVAKYGF